MAAPAVLREAFGVVHGKPALQLPLHHFGIEQRHQKQRVVPEVGDGGGILGGAGHHDAGLNGRVGAQQLQPGQTARILDTRFPPIGLERKGKHDVRRRVGVADQQGGSTRGQGGNEIIVVTGPRERPIPTPES